MNGRGWCSWFLLEFGGGSLDSSPGLYIKPPFFSNIQGEMLNQDVIEKLINAQLGVRPQVEVIKVGLKLLYHTYDQDGFTEYVVKRFEQEPNCFFELSKAARRSQRWYSLAAWINSGGARVVNDYGPNLVLPETIVALEGCIFNLRPSGRRKLRPSYVLDHVFLSARTTLWEREIPDVKRRGHLLAALHEHYTKAATDWYVAP